MAVSKKATRGVVSRSMSYVIFWGVAWCFSCMLFHIDAELPRPKPMKNLWILLSTQIFPVRELWPPSCCSQPHLPPKTPSTMTESVLKRAPGKEKR